MRDLRIILGKIFDGTGMLLANIMDNYLIQSLSWIATIFYMVYLTKDSNLFIIGLLIFIGFQYRKIKEFILETKNKGDTNES